MDRWAGKTAVVTGASAGIGAAVTVALANAGMRVIGLARRVQLIDQLKNQVTSSGNIWGFQCDLTNSDDVARSFKIVEDQFGGVDVLVNNAGVHVPGHITDVGDKKLSDTEICSVLDLNVKALMMCSRHAAASMKRRCVDGHIVLINSLAGHYEPFAPTFNIYPATKHAVSAFTKALLNEFAHFGSNIKVTSISPGLVSTEMTTAVLAQQDLPYLQPTDIANAVLYAVGTPPHVIISELTIGHAAEKRL